MRSGPSTSLGTSGFLTASRPEAAFAADRLVEFVDFVPLGLRDGGGDELGDAFAAADGEGLGRRG